MNIFLASKFTGENLAELGGVLGEIRSILESLGHDVFSSYFLEDYFQERGWSTEDIYEYCLKEQEKCDTFLAFIKSPDRSIGMEKELQKAQELKQTCILAIQEQLGFPSFRDQSSRIMEFGDLDDLYEQLKRLS